MDAQHASAPRNLDDLFCRASTRNPQALALVDPPDRERFTDHSPRRLTYDDADRAVDAIAHRFVDLGLAPGSVVAFQSPSIVESVVLLLGIWRAGLAAAPMPLLWRQADAVAALSKVTPRALVAVRRVDDTDHAEIAMHVAAEIFAVRYVCGFGAGLPDGLIELDETFDAADRPHGTLVQPSRAPEDIALLTFEARSSGIIPVPHTHRELMACGSAIVTAAGLEDRCSMIAALATSSFAGVGSIVVPWLITGGTLALHQSFSPERFAAQCVQDGCQTAIVPGPILLAMQEGRLLREVRALRQILAVWRSPEFLAGAPPWLDTSPGCIDIAAFGELGLIAQRRGPDGMPAGIPVGALGPEAAIETRTTSRGTLAVRGALVPRAGLGSGEDDTASALKADPDGFIDTEYPCRLDRDRNVLIITGPPAGLIHVGGYRFAWRNVQRAVGELGDGGSIAALPDRLVGHRLAGVAADRERIRTALEAGGANPLLVGAFRERS